MLRNIQSIRRSSSYSHAVIGAGVVGLAIAREISKNPANTVLLLEKNTVIGQETSSRNSEVIHAGLYYPPGSLKSRLCIEGKNLIYELKRYVDMEKCGKLVVAQTDYDDAMLENIYLRSKELDIPVEMIPSHKVQYLEPAIRAERGALLSPTTGIVSVHSLMEYLQSEFQGDLIVNTKVKDIERDGEAFTLLTEDGSSGEECAVTVDNVVNCGGLHAHHVANMLFPGKFQQYYGKGNYFTLASSAPYPVRHLIYPIPMPNAKSLGTHLTLDLNHEIRFGPDLEYVDEIDYTPNPDRLADGYKEIMKYYPHLQESDLVSGYTGIRPKLSKDSEFNDFYIKKEIPGFINLLGIESPGLTSSLAIAKHVNSML